MDSDRLKALHAQLDDEMTVAKLTLEKFTKQPMLPSKRGGPRLNPMWKVHNEALQNVVRLARQLRGEGEEITLDAELENLLAD